MKRLALALAMLGCGLAVSPFVASTFADAASGGGGGTKIGVIDIERTLYETPAGKRASDKFDKTRQAKQGELDKQQKQLQQDAADLDKQASMYKPDVLKQKRDDLEKKFVDLQQRNRGCGGGHGRFAQRRLHFTQDVTPKIPVCYRWQDRQARAT